MINIAVEGDSDREIAKSVVGAAGWTVNRVSVAGGKTRLDPLLSKYNEASAQVPWVVFRDTDSVCPVTLRTRLTASISHWHPRFVLRFAHSMSEAWLLSDAEAFSEYFRVPLNRVPSYPEQLPHAKQSLLALCANSRSRSIRRDMTISGAQIGPLYVLRVNDFASTTWRPAEAATASDSLQRALNRLRELHLPVAAS